MGRDPIRAAIAGTGLMGRWHAAALSRAGGVLACAIDPNPQVLTNFLRKHPRVPGYGSLQEALSRTRIDVVHLCSPAETHASLARMAIQAGLSLLIEKPLATCANECADLLQKAHSKGIVLCPVHQFPWQRGVAQAIRNLPALGELIHLEMTFCSAGAETGGSRLPKRDLRDDIAFDIVPHPLSIVNAVLPGSLSRTRWSSEHIGPGELRLLGHGNAPSVFVLISMNARPTACAARLYGTKGALTINFFHGYSYLERGTVSRFQKATQPFVSSFRNTRAAGLNLSRRLLTRELAYPGLRELIQAFYLSVAGQGSNPIPADEVMQIARIRDSVMASAMARAE